MTLRLPNGDLHDPTWTDLADRITNGDGLQWRGDPRLYLGIGALKDRKQKTVAHRLEVWRYCEDGTEQLIGSWHPSESFRIPMDLCQMDPRSPGHVPVAVRLEAQDKARAEEVSQGHRESAFQALEHAAWIHVRENEPQTKFAGIPGRRDDPGTPEPAAETPAP